MKVQIEQNSKLLEENEQLKIELAESLESCKDVKGALAAKEENAKILAKKNDELAERLAEQTDESANLTDERRRLFDEIGEVRRELEAMRKEAESSKERETRLKGLNAELTNRLREAQEAQVSTNQD